MQVIFLKNMLFLYDVYLLLFLVRLRLFKVD